CQSSQRARRSMAAPCVSPVHSIPKGSPVSTCTARAIHLPSRSTASIRYLFSPIDNSFTSEHSEPLRIRRGKQRVEPVVQHGVCHELGGERREQHTVSIVPRGVHDVRHH